MHIQLLSTVCFLTSLLVCKLYNVVAFSFFFCIMPTDCNSYNNEVRKLFLISYLISDTGSLFSSSYHHLKMFIP